MSNTTFPIVFLNDGTIVECDAFPSFPCFEDEAPNIACWDQSSNCWGAVMNTTSGLATVIPPSLVSDSPQTLPLTEITHQKQPTYSYPFLVHNRHLPARHIQSSPLRLHPNSAGQRPLCRYLRNYLTAPDRSRSPLPHLDFLRRHGWRPHPRMRRIHWPDPHPQQSFCKESVPGVSLSLSLATIPS